MPRLLLTLFALISLTSPAFAHKLIVDPRVKGDRLHVEVFFEDDTPAQQAKVTLLNGDVVVAEGRTDEKGVWSCSKPMSGTYLVKAESLGHAAKETVVIAGAVSVSPSITLEQSAPEVADNPASSTESGREEKTRTPWLRVAVGLGSILVLTLLFMLWRRASRPSPAD